MSHFLEDESGKPLVDAVVDAVFRIEDQMADMCAALSLIMGERIKLLDIFSKNRALNEYVWSDLYQQGDREFVADLYAQDFERFGYV